MMNGKKIVLAVIFSSAFCFATATQAAVMIETSVSRSQVGVGQDLVLDIVIENADGPIAKPSFSPPEGFTSYSQGHSQEISFINGRKSSRSVFSYVLVANSQGAKTIGPFEIQINGKTYKAASVQVQVVPGSQNIAQRMPVTPPPQRALPGADFSHQDIYVKAWLDKDEVFVNEPAMLTYTLYTRVSATYKGFTKEPETVGFWVEDFPPEKTIRRSEQIIGSSRYVVADVRKLALFPTQAGVFTIQPGTLSSVVEIRGQDPFDSFFSANVFGQRRVTSSFPPQMIARELPTDSIALTVKALPSAGRPDGFSGAVGNYQISSSIDKPRVRAGDAVTFRVRLAGQGNLNTVQLPSLPEMENFKMYESSSSANVSKERLVVEGEKIAETVIVPKKAGMLTVPALHFSYFDPRTADYKKLETAPHTLTVLPSTDAEEEPSTETGVQPARQSDVAVVAKDIRFIKTSDSGQRPSKPYPLSPLYWAANILLAALAAFFWIAARKRSDRVKDERGFRMRRSHRTAQKRLKGAARFLRSGKSEEFYAEISKAAYGYFADKLGIPEQSLTAEEIERRLAQDERSKDLAPRFHALFGDIAHGRYARAEKNNDEMKKIYAAADELITACEKAGLQ